MLTHQPLRVNLPQGIFDMVVWLLLLSPAIKFRSRKMKTKC